MTLYNAMLTFSPLLQGQKALSEEKFHLILVISVKRHISVYCIEFFNKSYYFSVRPF